MRLGILLLVLLALVGAVFGQCWIDENKESHCNPDRVCTTNPEDGSVSCI